MYPGPPPTSSGGQALRPARQTGERKSGSAGKIFFDFDAMFPLVAKVLEMGERFPVAECRREGHFVFIQHRLIVPNAKAKDGIDHRVVRAADHKLMHMPTIPTHGREQDGVKLGKLNGATNEDLPRIQQLDGAVYPFDAMQCCTRG
jgi:hypothetical protein